MKNEIGERVFDGKQQITIKLIQNVEEASVVQW